MRKIPRKWWKAIHSTSFVLFVMSTVHAFTAGTDHANRAVQWSALAMTGIFIFLTAYKQLAPRRGAGRRAAAAVS
jgi:DMSO/TMAO reductase YedYZ heme-binding membrane subunit